MGTNIFEDTFYDDLNFFYSASSYFFWIEFPYFAVTNMFLILGEVCFVVSSAALPWKQAEENNIRQLQYLR